MPKVNIDGLVKATMDNYEKSWKSMAKAPAQDLNSFYKAQNPQMQKAMTSLMKSTQQLIMNNMKNLQPSEQLRYIEQLSLKMQEGFKGSYGHLTAVDIQGKLKQKLPDLSKYQGKS